MTNSRIVLLLSGGKLGTIKVEDIKENIFLPAKFDQNNILGMLTENGSDEVILGFNSGHLAKIATNNFIINRKITNNGYYSDSELNFVKTLNVNLALSIKATAGNKEMTLKTIEINQKKSRFSKGIMTLKPKNDEITTFEII